MLYFFVCTFRHAKLSPLREIFVIQFISYLFIFITICKYTNIYFIVHKFVLRSNFWLFICTYTYSIFLLHLVSEIQICDTKSLCTLFLSYKFLL